MIRIRQVNVKIDAKENELIKQCAKKLKIKEEKIKDYKIIKKSIDARDKENIVFSYEVDVNVENEKEILRKNKTKDITKSEPKKYEFKITGNKKMEKQPIIIGAGPAGLFCGYMLAKYGYRPIIIERGEKVEDRVKTVEKFWKEGILNKESNVQFGEGGAGTFSDGKLNTLVKDKDGRNKKVLEIFVEMGAPEEILYLSKPHIGTDLLRNVIINLRNKILEMGGTIKYNSCLTNIKIENSKIKEIEINSTEKIETDIVILALGHSSRDTFRMLEKQSVPMEAKPFAVGVRVQHLQDKINYAQYGNLKEKLPPAPYKLTYHASNGRGVYSFCMCPGGFVVNASSEDGKLAINGMSNYLRDTKNANSAIVVTVTTNDFNGTTFGGLELQEDLERKAFELGNGNIPVQKLKDFLENKKSEKFGDVKPIFKGKTEFANLNELFPDFILEALKEAFPKFDNKIKGFLDDDTILAGVETRTSSPIRILRDENGQSKICGLFPAGEGAGYAGGIMSAAMDGIKIAENIAKIYCK